MRKAILNLTTEEAIKLLGIIGLSAFFFILLFDFIGTVTDIGDQYFSIGDSGDLTVTEVTADRASNEFKVTFAFSNTADETRQYAFRVKGQVIEKRLGIDHLNPDYRESLGRIPEDGATYMDIGPGETVERTVTAPLDKAGCRVTVLAGRLCPETTKNNHLGALPGVCGTYTNTEFGTPATHSAGVEIEQEHAIDLAERDDLDYHENFDCR